MWLYNGWYFIANYCPVIALSYTETHPEVLVFLFQCVLKPLLLHLLMKSFILGSQHSCSWISFEGWQNPDQRPWFWSLTMKLSGVTLVMPSPEIIAIITQITTFVNPDPKLVHLFPAMWESFKRKFYLEDWEETWKWGRGSIILWFLLKGHTSVMIFFLAFFL